MVPFEPSSLLITMSFKIIVMSQVLFFVFCFFTHVCCCCCCLIQAGVGCESFWIASSRLVTEWLFFFHTVLRFQFGKRRSYRCHSGCSVVILDPLVFRRSILSRCTLMVYCILSLYCHQHFAFKRYWVPLQGSLWFHDVTTCFF